MAEMKKVFIIAEAGSTHDGDLEKAKRLVALAADAGCQAFKGQYWSDAKALAARRNAEAYLAVYERYAMPVEWLETLARHCEGYKIEFMATAYLPGDVAIVAPYVKRFKIASFEARDREFLNEHNKFPQPVVLSTGMMTMDDVHRSVITFKNLGAVLHCCSAYPAPLNQINLGAIQQLRQQLRTAYLGVEHIRVGFSDHTKMVATGGLAVAAGADILEVHFRLATTDPKNPDYGHSMTAPMLKEYVDFANMAADMMGDGEKRIMESEQPMAAYRVGV